MSDVRIRAPRAGDGAGVARAWCDFAEYYREIDPESFQVALPRVFVNALAVQRRHWRSGAGSMLMTAVEQWARERGARLVTLDTYAASPVSVPFYEHRMGYHRQGVIFAKRLGEAG